jgi:hypothetical protein
LNHGNASITQQKGVQLANETGIAPPELFSSLGNGPDGFGHEFCFVVDYKNENSTGLRMTRKALSDAGRKLVTEPAEGHIRYFSPVSGKQIDKKILMVASILMSKIPDCVAKFSHAR